MKFINLTPHDVVVRLADGSNFVIPKSGQQTRVAVKQIDRAPLLTDDGKQLAVVANEYGDIEGLPAVQEGTIFIVSILVLGQVQGRSDCFAPDTSPAGAVRNEAGQIEAVKRLVAAS
jgi:hypothetical protein